MSDDTRDTGNKDDERNSLGGRVKRYGQVGTGVGGLAAKAAGSRLFGYDIDDKEFARELRGALGQMKGPIMKVAQLLSTIPDALPPEYAAELSQLQADAPSMGWAFVKRRMRAELGAGWEKRFGSFSREAVAAASLGQVHEATDGDGQRLACKLQYPDMQSAVEADLRQLKVLFSLHRRVDGVIDTSEIYEELGDRLREELDYTREAAHMRLYDSMLSDEAAIYVPRPQEDLSTGRLLTMSWLDGAPLMDFVEEPLEVRNRIAENMFRAWWFPFSHYGVIHGDPHLGNYTIRSDQGVNLMDYGCIRIFSSRFVGGVVELYRALREDDFDRAAAAYATWGFRDLDRELIEILNIWARFIYGPLMDDRVRTIADGVKPAEYGRKQAFTVRKALKEKGRVTIPREFVFMDRAAIGLGAVFLHLAAELNFHRLFDDTIRDFDPETLARRQADAVAKAGVPAAA